MLKLQNIKKSYDGTTVLDGISLEIPDGEIVSILGPSGCGKTTLLNMILGITEPDSGSIEFNGKDITDSPMEKRGFNIVFQDYALFPNLNVYQNITYGLKNKPDISSKEEVEELIGLLGLKEHLPKKIEQLSGGQKQRVAIARALATNPKILLCDEATSALDPTTTKAILALLKEINQKFKITIVIITHEMAVVEEICNQVAIVDAGKLVETGSATDVFSKPQTEIAKQLVYKEEANQLEVGGKRYVRVVFDGNSSFEPAIADMILNCRVRVNIMGADMKNIDGKAYGQMILQMPDEDVKAQQAIHYLEDRNIIVEEVTAHGNTGTH